MLKRIAIVEDDPAIAEMYRFKLEKEGYEVQTAGNGKLGLELVEQMLPDLLLLDLMMPEMKGDEMLARMRATPWGRDITVIIITNVTEPEDLKPVEHLGVARVISQSETTPRQVAYIVKAELPNKKH